MSVTVRFFDKDLNPLPDLEAVGARMVDGEDMHVVVEADADRPNWRTRRVTCYRRLWGIRDK